MTTPGNAAASAEDATVVVVENAPDPFKDLMRRRADVVMCQRVVDELADAPERVEAKYARFTAGQAEELAEAHRMQEAAAAALDAAIAALDEVEGN